MTTTRDEAGTAARPVAVPRQRRLSPEEQAAEDAHREAIRAAKRSAERRQVAVMAGIGLAVVVVAFVAGLIIQGTVGAKALLCFVPIALAGVLSAYVSVKGRSRE